MWLGMKTRFLDARNCHNLLPQGHGLPLAQRLEECLIQINDSEGPLKGSIYQLIRQNKKTQNAHQGSARYLNSLVEIGQASDVATRLVNTRAIAKPQGGPAKLHTILAYEDRMAWKTVVPLQFLLKGWGDANRGHQCYVHVLSHNLGQVKSFEDMRARAEADSDEFYYVGITGRNWLTRLSEHIGEMRRGSRRAFYNAWRDSLGMKDVLFVSSLMDINLTYDDAMKWEEVAVDRFSYGPNGLNMIPGGVKGLKFLHKLGIIARQDISLEEREKAVAEYVRRNPRKGTPNPFMAELWKDDQHYLKVNEAHPKRLSAPQVTRIRELAAEGISIGEIVKAVGALSENQVKNVISGRTYRRVRSD